MGSGEDEEAIGDAFSFADDEARRRLDVESIRREGVEEILVRMSILRRNSTG